MRHHEMQKIALLCFFLTAVPSLSAEDALPCYDGPFDDGAQILFTLSLQLFTDCSFSVLLDGCVDDCKSFETLAEAEEYCTSLENCGGITKSAYGDQEAINLGVGLYEVRQVCRYCLSFPDLTDQRCNLTGSWNRSS